MSSGRGFLDNKKSKSFILDGTFSHYEVAKKNIARSVKRGRSVIIVYVYQKPELAWMFTKKRELKEGRNIPREVFIEQFLGARKTVQRIKDEFKKEIELWLIQKSYDRDRDSKINLNIDRIDSYIAVEYSESELYSVIQ